MNRTHFGCFQMGFEKFHTNYLMFGFMQIVSLISLTACQQDPIALTQFPDLGVNDFGMGDSNDDFDSKDGGGRDWINVDDSGKCIPEPKGEVCDGRDNDCNDKVDDVDPIKLQ